MGMSSLLHYPKLPPAITMRVFKNVSTVIFTPKFLSPYNTGLCEGGEAILSLLATHQTGGLCCPQYSTSIHTVVWAARRRGSPASQSRV